MTRPAQVLCFWIALLAACRRPRTATPHVDAGAIAGEAPFRIGLLARSTSHPGFLAVRVGAESAARDWTAALHRPIDVEWITPTDEQGQAQAVADAVRGGVKALLVASADPDAVTPAIDDAVARGVPVMTLEHDAPASRRFAFWGVDDRRLGRDLVREMAAVLGERGKIAVLAGPRRSSAMQVRIEGAKEEALRHHGLELVGVFRHLETPLDATAELLRVEGIRSDIEGWVLLSGWALYQRALLDGLRPRVRIVAVDGLPAQLAYVRKGIAPVLLAPDLFEGGYRGVSALVDKALRGKDVPPVFTAEVVRITGENLGAWAKRLAVWGFADVPEDYLRGP